MSDDRPTPPNWRQNRARRLNETRRLADAESLAEPERLAAPEQAFSSRGRRIGQALANALLVLLGIVLVGVAGTLGVYAYYARTLPSVDELSERAETFQSARIYDRNGELLFEFFDPTGGRRSVVAYDEIPTVVIQATVATEDGSFFTNAGVSPLSTARALWQNLRAGEAVFGGSTITQQVAKNVFLTTERTLDRKIQEAILATELTRRYSKNDILAVYLNNTYFGNLAYGISAAAETYFGKDVADLDLHEAALLAGLIQAPVYWDPYTNPDGALGRRSVALGLMERRGYITAEEAQAAGDMPLDVQATAVNMRAPHMVMTVRQQLEQLVGEGRLYREGLQVYTTLDLELQEQAEAAVSQGIANLEGLNATNAALVAMDPQTGEVLAMVGSADFWSEAIAGQVNVALQPRQPGSTIKPLTYLAALEMGWTPATMLMDVEQDFPDGANPPYRPVNYDGKFVGPLSLRAALGASRNIPAVYTLEQIGLPALLEMSSRLGITTLTRPDYGLSLTLGGGEVTLLEMTGAYAALANGGYRVTPRTILTITDPTGKPILEPEVPESPAVIDPRRAFLITDILADNAARTPAFGAESAMVLPFPAAVKTGTTNDNRDGWTVGYTPNLVTGVWVGNSDNTPMAGLSGSRSAAPIWGSFMASAPANAAGTPFARPEGIVELEVCPVSGHPRTEDCPPARREIFVADQAPTDRCPVHTRVAVCQVSGKLATEFCPLDTVEQRPVEDYGQRFDGWAVALGKVVPPRERCAAHAAAPQVAISLPAAPLSGVVDVTGSAEAPGFQHYRLELGAGQAPEQWQQISPMIAAPVAGGLLYTWDTTIYVDGIYSLRVVVQVEGRTVEATTVTEVRNAPPVAEPTRTALPTPTPTTTVLPTSSPTEPLPTVTVTPALPTLPPLPTEAPPTLELPTAEPTSSLAPPTLEPAPPIVALPTVAPQVQPNP